MLVRDIMTVNVVTINQNQTLLELQGLMSDDNIRRVPVVNDAGMVVGIITDKDVRMSLRIKMCGWLPLRKQVPSPVTKLPTC